MRQLHKQVILLYLLTSVYPANAQPGIDSSFRPVALTSAIQQYHSALIPNQTLYNGYEYLPHPQRFQSGHPYFMSDKPVTGLVYYNNRLFEDVSLMFDMIRDELVVIHPFNNFKIRLTKSKVDSFVLADHHFIHVRKDSGASGLTAGYYEKLYSGGVTLLKKQVKAVEEQLETGTGVIFHVSSSSTYFLRKDKKYYPIRNQRSIFRALADRKKELRTFYNQQQDAQSAVSGGKGGTDKEKLFIETVAHYDQIND